MPVSGGTARKSVERRLAPLQKRVAFAIALELEIGVLCQRVVGSEVVDLHRVIDDQFDRLQRIDLFRVAAHRRHRVAHRREIDDARNAGKILQQHARRTKRDFFLVALRPDPSAPALRCRRFVTERPSSNRSKFSSRIFSEYGSRASFVSPARSSAVETKVRIRAVADAKRVERVKAVGVDGHGKDVFWGRRPRSLRLRSAASPDKSRQGVRPRAQAPRRKLQRALRTRSRSGASRATRSSAARGTSRLGGSSFARAISPTTTPITRRQGVARLRRAGAAAFPAARRPAMASPRATASKIASPSLRRSAGIEAAQLRQIVERLRPQGRQARRPRRRE